jgi:hypothetical protein
VTERPIRAITGTNWNGPRFFGMREVKDATPETHRGGYERRILRCAVYTRKSSEQGLEQDFNSLDAQREARFSASLRCSNFTVGTSLIPSSFAALG